MFCSGVNFPAVPVFAKKIHITRAGKNFCGRQNAGIFLFVREKPTRAGTYTQGNVAVPNLITNDHFPRFQQGQKTKN